MLRLYRIKEKSWGKLLLNSKCAKAERQSEQEGPLFGSSHHEHGKARFWVPLRQEGIESGVGGLLDPPHLFPNIEYRSKCPALSKPWSLPENKIDGSTWQPENAGKT